MRKRFVWAGMVGLLALGVVASAQAQRIWREVMPPIRMDALRDFVRAARVEMPRRQENLTIFPVVVGYRPDLAGVLTMEEAMDRGSLVISEYAGGEVNRLSVRNEGKLPVFLMSGEIIAGAKQDRTISQDTLVAPNTRIALDVYCVEHGRWTQKTERFYAAKAAAPATLRAAPLSGKPAEAQSKVWGRVAEFQTRTRTVTATGSLNDTYQSERVQRRLAPARAKLAHLPSEIGEANGVIVAVGDDIIAADVFATPALFRKLWPRLLDSYLMDAMNRPEFSGRVSRERAQEFLRSALQDDQDPRPTQGVGRLISLRGETLGTALIYREAVVHLQLFPGVQIMKDEPRPRRTPSLEFRREQLQRGRY